MTQTRITYPDGPMGRPSFDDDWMMDVLREENQRMLRSLENFRIKYFGRPEFTEFHSNSPSCPPTVQPRPKAGGCAINRDGGSEGHTAARDEE